VLLSILKFDVFDIVVSDDATIFGKNVSDGEQLLYCTGHGVIVGCTTVITVFHRLVIHLFLVVCLSNIIYVIFTSSISSLLLV